MTTPQLLSLCVSVFLLCSCVPEVDHAPSEIVTRSKSMAQDLQTTLSPQLKSALQSGGPEQALAVCQQMAQPLTASVSEKYPDATISRVALRYRNPANKADPTSSSILEKWEATLAAGETLPTSVMTHSETSTVIHQPILTQAVCLKCHGATEDFSTELKQLLAEHYPNDQATRFKVDELRGAFRIELQSQ